MTIAPTAWRVPIEDNPVTVREADLFNFLTGWTAWHIRRPMCLLVENNLAAGRHEQGGGRGRLVIRPRAALVYLKYGIKTKRLKAGWSEEAICSKS